MTRERQLAPAILVVVIPLAILIAYVSAYFALGDVGTISARGTQIGIVRIYRLPAVAIVFRPAAMVEERMTGHRVRVKSFDE